MDNKELENWLLKEGVEYEDEDEDAEKGVFKVYQNEHISLYLYASGNVDIAFGHSASGYHSIKDAQPSQIKAIVSIFNTAKYFSTDPAGEIPRQHFKVTMLQILKDFYTSQTPTETPNK